MYIVNKNVVVYDRKKDSFYIHFATTTSKSKNQMKKENMNDTSKGVSVAFPIEVRCIRQSTLNVCVVHVFTWQTSRLKNVERLYKLYVTSYYYYSQNRIKCSRPISSLPGL